MFSKSKVFAAVAAAGAIAAAFIAFQGMHTTAQRGVDHKKKFTPAAITQLFIFPVSGCRGINVASWWLTPRGFAIDREFILVEDKEGGAKVNGLSALCRVRTKIVDGNGEPIDKAAAGSDFFKTVLETGKLVCEFDGTDGAATAAPPLVVPLSRTDDANRKHITIARYGSTGNAVDCGDESAAWFSQCVGKKVRLVRAVSDSDSSDSDNAARKPIDNKDYMGTSVTAEDKINFQAFGHLHLVSLPSLRRLQTFINKNSDGKPPLQVSVERFRANIVVDNSSASAAPLAPWQEDTWARCFIAVPEAGTNGQWSHSPEAAIRLRHAKHTARCAVPTMDPVTGECHPDYEPTRSIGLLHRAPYPHAVALFRLRLMEASQARLNGGAAAAAVVDEGEPPQAKPMFGTELFIDGNNKSKIVAVGHIIVPTELQPELQSDPSY